MYSRFKCNLRQSFDKINVSSFDYRANLGDIHLSTQRLASNGELAKIIMDLNED